jgi:hypothetical protein
MGLQLVRLQRRSGSGVSTTDARLRDVAKSRRDRFTEDSMKITSLPVLAAALLLSAGIASAQSVTPTGSSADNPQSAGSGTSNMPDGQPAGTTMGSGGSPTGTSTGPGSAMTPSGIGTHHRHTGYGTATNPSGTSGTDNGTNTTPPADGTTH